MALRYEEGYDSMPRNIIDTPEILAPGLGSDIGVTMMRTRKIYFKYIGGSCGVNDDHFYNDTDEDDDDGDGAYGFRAKVAHSNMFGCGKGKSVKKMGKRDGLEQL